MLQQIKNLLPKGNKNSFDGERFRDELLNSLRRTPERLSELDKTVYLLAQKNYEMLSLSLLNAAKHNKIAQEIVSGNNESLSTIWEQNPDLIFLLLPSEVVQEPLYFYGAETPYKLSDDYLARLQVLIYFASDRNNYSGGGDFPTIFNDTAYFDYLFKDLLESYKTRGLSPNLVERVPVTDGSHGTTTELIVIGGYRLGNSVQ